MRLYGSQSRTSKSAVRHARAHRPLVAFDTPARRVRSQSPTSPVPGGATPSKPRRLVPRSA